MTGTKMENMNTIADGQDIEVVGKEFASKFYDAITHKSGACRLDSFFDDKSKYLFLQRGGGRFDHEASGWAMIEDFVGRMKYGECAVTIETVDTIKVRPRWLTVLTVGQLQRPGETAARKFAQSTVVKYVPSAQKRFLIVGTVFKFDDDVIVHDILPTENESGVAVAETADIAELQTANEPPPPAVVAVAETYTTRDQDETTGVEHTSKDTSSEPIELKSQDGPRNVSPKKPMADKTSVSDRPSKYSDGKATPKEHTKKSKKHVRLYVYKTFFKNKQHKFTEIKEKTIKISDITMAVELFENDPDHNSNMKNIVLRIHESINARKNRKSIKNDLLKDAKNRRKKSDK